MRRIEGKIYHQALLRVKVGWALILAFGWVLTTDTDEEMVDEVAQQEEAELEALVSMMEPEHTADPPEPYERPETPYGSDDEEYDHIFLGVINEESRLGNKQSQDDEINKTDRDMMDIC